MKQKIILLSALLCVLTMTYAHAQKKSSVKAPAAEFSLPSTETDQEKADRMQWWTDARFGMFIHWGLYAMPARHEWVKQRERLTNEDYEKYFQRFNPDLFNPKEWARQAKAAGMKYVVLTTKHHEGFCMWDSQYTDYKVTNTPIGRDLLKEFVEAFRAEGIRIGFYYSLIDWHHPDFTIDRVHPLRIDEGTAEDYAKVNVGKDMSVYRQYMKNQVTELLSNYGKIDIIWFDFSYPGENGKGHEDWDSEGLLKLVRKLQPNIIVDNRLDLNDIWGGWDIQTPEQVKVAECPTWHGKKIHWETCQTFSGSWGYHRDENTWKSPAQLIELLVETVSKGGNLLLNVGPTARGTFDQRAQDRLAAMGKWMDFNDRAVYECTEAPEGIHAPANTLLTYNPKTNTLYISMLNYPLNRLNVDFMDKVDYAQFLHDASEVKFDKNGFLLPVLKPDTEIPVLEVFLK